MGKPTIIKGPLPSQAVEEWRKRHHGFLPSEERQWLDSLITAIRAALVVKITEEELDELYKLALRGMDHHE